MPSPDEFWQVAAQVASERGGLVVGFGEDATQLELGSTLDNVLGFRPLSSPTIVSVSDWADWKEQVEAFYRLRPSWGRGKAGDPNAKYYRVKFHDLDSVGARSASSSVADTPFPTVSPCPRLADMPNPSQACQVQPSGPEPSPD